MILGHVALAGIAKRVRWERESLLFLATAALFPDFLDKPLNMLFLLPGRGIGHSLVVFLAVATTAWFLAPKIKIAQSTIVAGMVLWVTHLAGDLVAWKVLFWPFLGPLDPTPQFHFWEKICQFYVDRLYPEQFWLDMGCVVAFLCIQVVIWAKPKPLANDSEPEAEYMAKSVNE
jgi:hypothetical protein